MAGIHCILWNYIPFNFDEGTMELAFPKSLLAVLMNSSSPNEDLKTEYETNRKLGYSWVNRTSAIIDLKKLKRIRKVIDNCARSR